MKAEFEEIQKNQRSMTSGATNLQNMDLAGDFASWMAGSNKPSTPTPPQTPSEPSKKPSRGKR